MRVFYLLSESEDENGNFHTDVIGAVERIEDANILIGQWADGRRISAITEGNCYERLGKCKRDPVSNRNIMYPESYRNCTLGIARKITCSKCEFWILTPGSGDNAIR